MRGWRPAQHGSGRKALFTGWFDNHHDIAEALDLPHSLSDAALYLAAVERWGDAADQRCIGSYAAVVADQRARSIRLVRSPWDGPPLYFHHSSQQAVVASVPRAIFAAGVPAQLNRKRLVQNLLFYFGEENADWYQDVSMVANGTIIELTPDGIRCRRFYNALDYIGRSRPSGDAAEQANALLEEAASKALSKIKRPGILLSGGLDSPLAAAAMLRSMAPDAPLHSFTFVPSKAWDGRIADGRMGNEEPLVRDFAAMHPNLKPQFFSNEGIGFDHKSREMLLAMGVAPAGMPNMYMFHALHEAANTAGCDGIVSAGLGNFTYSSYGHWALGDQFRRLQWGALARNLRSPELDWRSPSRRFAAYVAMPMLPEWLRARLRLWIKGAPPSSFIDQITALNPKLRASGDALDAQGRPVNPGEGTYMRDRRADVAAFLNSGAEAEADCNQGFEQIYGLPHRDISAYRPLVEHCLSLPGSEYLADGLDRRLARRMGVGRLPESIRMNRLYGSHGVDWHLRMSAQREELLGEVKRYREDPELAELLDIERMIDALENWPDEDPLDMAVSGACFIGVTRTVWTSRYVHFVNGKN